MAPGATPQVDHGPEGSRADRVLRPVLVGNGAGGARGAAASARVESTLADVATYVYCIVRSATKPPLPRRGARLPDAGPPRCLQLAADRWLIVADVPLGTYGQDPLATRLSDVDWISRCGIAHQTAVETYLRSDAVVPMTLFTIFSSDFRALEEVRRDGRRIAASLERVARRTEWVVRILRSERVSPVSPTPMTREARGTRVAGLASGPASASSSKTGSRAGVETTSAAASAMDDEPQTPDGAASGSASGRAFLQAKLDQRQALRRAAEDTDAAARALSSSLTALSDAVKDRTQADSVTGATPMLDAAFLVERSAEARFRRTARQLAEPLAARGYRVSITGPWPCYSFASGAQS